MQDRFKFRAIVKGYYYIDTPDKCEKFEPLIFLENIDVLDIGDIGISEEDLEIAIRKQYTDLQDVYVERIMENFRDNSNGVDTYITITPEQLYQCTGLKDENGTIIYEGDVVQILGDEIPYVIEFEQDKAMFVIHSKIDRVCYNFDNYSGDDLYVIGNKFENPELLEVTND